MLGGDFAALVRVHAEWALGVERFAGLRGARLDGGVSPALTMAEVIGDAGVRDRAEPVDHRGDGSRRATNGARFGGVANRSHL